MKIAIHHRLGSFSDRWIAYCKRERIDYKIVNAYDSDIIEQVKDCDTLMWHHHHENYRDVLAAKPILFALEHAGVKVFPDYKTDWHFDNKVAQKYLLEAIGAPLIPSYVFYDKEKAITWVKNTTFPKVFKLKGGAGSANVSLVKTKREALKKVNKAFGRGFSQFNRWEYFKERYRKFKSSQDNFMGVLKGLGRLFIPIEYAKMGGREKGYVYFQEFIPNNDFDIRVIVIGNRAFAVKRLVRKNDFRASGSGNKSYNKADIDLRCVQIAFDTNKVLRTQSIGYDFVFNSNNEPHLVEMGYGFSIEFYDQCPGYWTTDMQWNEGKFNPQEWMVEDLIAEIRNEQTKINK